NGSDAVIQPLDHLGILLARAADHVLRGQRRLTAVVWSLKRRMRCVEWHIKKERLLRAAQKAARFFSNQISHVALPLDWLIVLIEHRLATRLVVVEIIDIAAERAEGVIKAVLQRQKLRLISQMPFAANRRSIASLIQSAGEHAALHRQSQFMLIR